MKTQSQMMKRITRLMWLAATVILVGQYANAQQWTTNGNDISNTNTGNVGVGTSSPGAKFDLSNLFSGTAAMRIRGAAGQSANLLEFRASDNSLRSYFNPAGALFFNPAMDQVAAAITVAPNFNGQYYASAEHNTFVIDGANMGSYGLYTNPTVRMFVIKDVNGFRAVEVNKIGMMTLRGDMANRSWVTNIHVDSSNAYYAGDADGLLINGAGLTNHGLYTGYDVRLLRVVGTGEALAVTRHNLTGFGTLTPGARVDIRGTGTTSGSVALTVKNSAASTLFHVRDDGNIGVGTTTPAYKLDVNGEINATGIRINGTPISGGGGGPWSGTGSIHYTGGNVGIGTTAPNQALTVGGWNQSGFGYTAQFYSGNTTTPTNQLNITDTKDTWGLILGSNGASVAQSSYHGPNWAHVVNVENAPLSLGANNTAVLNLTSSGNPAAHCGNALLNNSNAWGGGVAYYPLLGSTACTGGLQGLIMLSAPHIPYSSGNAGAFTRMAASAAATNYWDAGLLGDQYMIRRNAGSAFVTVTNGGNVGIGNSAPSEKLHVTGNIAVTGTGNITASGTIEGGNIKAKYQDLAEWVPAAEQLEAGTVVVLDTTQSNQVISSTTTYDTRVAGVISAQPGITLGEGGEGKVLVATTGRVRVKVDASRAPIQIGDLLVTSDITGVAMKSEAVNLGGVQIHRPGTIIGKALEPLAKGSGEILVLLSLQ